MKPYRLAKVLLVSLILTALAACGGGSNNDQGVSFTAVGFTADQVQQGNQRICTPQLFSSQIFLQISYSNLANESVVPQVESFKCLQIQNNLESQTLRAERALIRYEIAGAQTQPPSSSVNFSHVLGPLVNNATENIDTTLPEGIGPTNIPNNITAFVQVVSPEVLRWMSLNRSQLPEPPFNMNVYVAVSGVTSAGDRLVSNEAGLVIVVSNDNVINRPTTTTAALNADGSLPVGSDGTVNDTDFTSENVGETNTGSDDSVASNSEPAPTGATPTPVATGVATSTAR
jgi:hypothetical protein